MHTIVTIAAALTGVLLVIVLAPGPVGFGTGTVGLALGAGWIVGLALLSWRESRR